MPREKDLKRLVRARMKKTGEAYTAARTQILKKPRRKTQPHGATAPRLTTPAASARKDLAEVAGMSDAAITKNTGRAWEEWVRVLDGHAASQMQHSDIAKLVSDTYGVRPWWTQAVAVGYERIKGLRAHGQRRDGSYEANKSRTFDAPAATVFDAWADPAIRRRWLNESGVKVRTATAPKSMRLGWPDGTIVAVWFTAKGASKTAVAVAHTKLPDRAVADGLKEYWTERLDALAEVIGNRE
jgi:uncharacterized protein YndB with AHSA1/START domain